MRIKVLFFLSMGCLAITAAALATALMLRQISDYRAAGRLTDLVAVDARLMLLAEKVVAERMVTVDTLLGPTTATPALTQRIAAAQAASDAAIGEAAGIIGQLRYAGVPQQLAGIDGIRTLLQQWRPKVAAATAMAKADRDPAVLTGYIAAFVDPMAVLDSSVDASDIDATQSDGVIKDLVELARQSWHIRLASAGRTGPLLPLIGAGKPIPPEVLERLAAAVATLDGIWRSIDGIASRLSNIGGLGEQVEKAHAAFAATGPLYLRTVQAGRTGAPYPTGAVEFGNTLVAGATAAVPVRDLALADASARAAERARAAWMRMLLMTMVSLFILSVTVFIAVLLTRRIVLPIVALTRVIEYLAGGQYTVEIPARGRHDELGRMAAAIEVLRVNAIAAMETAAAREAEQAAKARRGVRLEGLLHSFEGKIGSLAGTIAAESRTLSSTSDQLTSTAGATGEQTDLLAAAARQASETVQALSTSAEDLNASIREITGQVAQSADVARRAAAEASRTDGTVRALSDSAQRIGDVVGLISSIAGQTSLLALNATIEAARAGDAGKGFAVVASEVKTLAAQTAKATGDIGVQIAAVQGATREAVAAIQGIAGTIAQLSAISATIASAVEGQGAVTAEIARNVGQTSTAVNEVTMVIGGVTQVTRSTGAAAGSVLNAAQDLSVQAANLSREVDAFVVDVRAA